MTDPFDLQRFLDAQAPVYPQVLAELRGGRKQSHWMWFIFPQFAGLGHSAMAQRFAIASRDEAVAYLGHGVLGSLNIRTPPRGFQQNRIERTQRNSLPEGSLRCWPGVFLRSG